MRFGIWDRFGFTPLFDTDGGGAPGAPAGNPGAAPAAPSGAPSGTPAPAGTPATPGSGTPSGAAAPPTGFTYKEDRSAWVPSHVVRQRTEALEKANRELDYHKRQVAALTGVKPTPVANPEHDQIKADFLAVFPHLKPLLDADPDKLGKLLSLDPDAFSQQAQGLEARMWQNHSQRATQVFETKITELYGGAPTPKQLNRILSAFAAEASADDQMRTRYERGDFTVIEEFLTDWAKEFVEPIRKTVSQPTPGMIAARRLPRAGGGSAVTGPKPPSLKPSDGDKFHNAAFDAFVNASR